MAKKPRSRHINITVPASETSETKQTSGSNLAASGRPPKTGARKQERAAAQAPSATARTRTGPAAVKAGQARFPIVGIGASAGGLEALETLFKAMPANTGAGFVLVVHLDPTHISILPELLQKHTTMPVCQVEDGAQVKPDHVYIIPPNKALAILHGTLQLLEIVKPRGINLPIDSFLRSLAQDQGHNAVCIILSGTGTDGTLGVKAIKGGVGMVMVQDEKSAKYDGMPRSAIATGLADYVLPPEKMGEQLIKYTRHAAQQVEPGVALAEGPLQRALQKIFVIIRTRTGHDFSLYKRNTICRRIERRMNVHQIDNIDDFVTHLQKSDREAHILFKELLIGVTNFFRDPDAFRILQEEVLPKLLADKPDDYSIRVWVPGCSSGEEAYSVAILLHECMEQTSRHLHIQIFGTDIDEDAIAVARAGLFPASVVTDVGAERINRYFTKEDNGSYRVKKLLREMLVFAPQNLIKDPPFTKLDLLCCRNLLIYLGTDLQRRLLPTFHYSLKPDGILFLGSSETIGPATNLFSPLNKKWRIFERKALTPGTTATLDFPSRRDPPGPHGLVVPEAVQRAEELSAQQLVATILQHSNMPPCAIIDDALDVVYIHGRIGKFLEPAEGKASVNILEMARPGLRGQLAATIRQVVIHKKEATSNDLTLDDDESKVFLKLSVKPILEHIAMRGLMMVVFEQTSARPTGSKNKAKQDSAKRSHKNVAQLEQELKYTTETLETTIEELETSNEELKSTNEELQSTNEELQSTNEELETSKEELQSLNEEAATVNAELQARIDDLTSTNDDMKNLLDSTDIATIFLDTEMRVRRFTPKATAIIPLTTTDAGRPIQHLASKLIDTDIAEFGTRVLQDLVVREVDVVSRDDNNFVMRVRPYRTVANVIEGVVITFENITERKLHQQALTESEQRFRLLFELSGESLVLIDPKLERFVEFNQRAHEQLGYTREAFANLALADIEAKESSKDFALHMAKIAEQGGDAFETRHKSRDGQIRDVSVKITTITIDERLFLLGVWRYDTLPNAAKGLPC